MCGIFAFIGTKPDRVMLRLVASRAAERGPDGFGVAAVVGGRVAVTYGDGTLADSINVLDGFADAVAVLGHCRLPTQGGRDAKHPFPCGDGWLVHNGNVYDAARYGYRTVTECDSEVLACAVAARPSVTAETLLAVAERMHGSVPFVVAFLSPSRLAVARFGHPLFLARREEGFYLSSRSFEGAAMIDRSFFQRTEA